MRLLRQRDRSLTRWREDHLGRQSSSTNVELKFKRAVKWYQLMIGGAAGELDCSLVEWRTPQMTDDRRTVMFEIFEELSSCTREVYVEWVE